jgi:antitoxin ParD1/3/4
MQHSTSVLLGDHFEKFISAEVSSGRYSSADEVIKSALRLLESEEFKKQYLIEALEKGEKSGFVTNFDPKAHLMKLNKTVS